jgi:hypothetical protein
MPKVSEKTKAKSFEKADSAENKRFHILAKQLFIIKLD